MNSGHISIQILMRNYFYSAMLNAAGVAKETTQCSFIT